MSDTAPAGWYPDPRDTTVEFWWDGTQYTESRPVASDAPAIPQPPADYSASVNEPPAFVAPGPSTDYAPTANVPAVYTPPAAYAPVAYGQPAYVQTPVYYPVMLGGVSPKSRTVATVLSIFLGGIGIDRFYLGNIGLGVAKLLVGWLSFGIWPLIDFIIIVAGQARDGQGLRVVNWN